MRILTKSNIYIFVSIAVTAIVVSQTAQDHHYQTFPTVVALAHSRSFSVIFSNFLISLNFLGGKILLKTFFGTVHAQESQRISERLLGMIFESCLTLTFFHSSLTPVVACVCIGQFLVKLLIHLCYARQQLIEQNVIPAQRPSTIRLAALLMVIFNLSIVSCNFFIMSNTAESNHQNNTVTISLLFACEAAVSAIQCFSIGVKVLLNEIERFQGRLWESKGLLRFYAEIASDVLIAIINIFFVVRIWMKVSAPYFLGRQLFINVRNVFKGITDVTTYRGLVRKIDGQIPNATPEQVEASDDKVCNICYDDLTFGAGAAVVKRLPCGHHFHRQCLLRWFERHASCPYCRKDLAPAPGAAAPPAEQAAAAAGGGPGAAAAAAQQRAAAAVGFAAEAAAIERDLQRLGVHMIFREVVRQQNNNRGGGGAADNVVAPGRRGDGGDDDERNSGVGEQRRRSKRSSTKSKSASQQQQQLSDDATLKMYEWYQQLHAQRHAEKVRDAIQLAKSRGFAETTTAPQQPQAAPTEETPTTETKAAAPPSLSSAVAQPQAVDATSVQTPPKAAPSAARESALLRRLGAPQPPPPPPTNNEAATSSSSTDASSNVPTAAAPAAGGEPSTTTQQATPSGPGGSSAMSERERAELEALRAFVGDMRRAMDRFDRALGSP